VSIKKNQFTLFKPPQMLMVFFSEKKLIIIFLRKKIRKKCIFDAAPEIGGVRTASLMTMAIARMVRRKREILAGLLVSSKCLSQLALLRVADGFPCLP
jgi:hypothetical protein